MIQDPSAEYLARLQGKAQHAYEHGDGFAVPVEVTRDPELIDISWHNDVCPAFAVRSDDEDTPIILWIDHPNPDERENDGAERFTVAYAGDLYYEGNDITAAIDALKTAVRERRQ